MAVINIYVDQNGETKSTRVDESTIHKIGEEIELDDSNLTLHGLLQYYHKISEVSLLILIN